MSIARIARWHLLFGLSFALAGMALGIYMASSKNHVQQVTHAHILLVGFVVSTLYAVVYRLWLDTAAARVRLALAQTALHQVGATVLSVGLAMLFGNAASEATLGPVLGIASLCVLAGGVLLLVQVVAATEPARQQGRAPLAADSSVRMS